MMFFKGVGLILQIVVATIFLGGQVQAREVCKPDFIRREVCTPIKHSCDSKGRCVVSQKSCTTTKIETQRCFDDGKK